MPAAEIARQRLYHQRLSPVGLTTPAEVVAWLLAVQAQDYPGAKWSLGMRAPGSTDADVERTLSESAILRTWVMRGTLHFVHAADMRWLLALLAPRLISGNARRYRELELDVPTMMRSNEILAKALQGGRRRDRPELLAILEANGISTRGQRAPYLLQRASLDELICQGVTRRNQPVYQSLDETVPKARMLEREEALAELARRYFASRGPATLQDFTWWSGLAAADARAGLETVKAQFVQQTIDDRAYWLAPDAPNVEDDTPAIHLLPSFDEYLLGYSDRSAVLDEQHFGRVYLANRMSLTMAIDGRIAGIWKREVKKGTLIVTPQPFRPFTFAEGRAFEAAAHRYGEFWGMPVEIVGPRA
jgi:hypothetical protein